MTREQLIEVWSMGMRAGACGASESIAEAASAYDAWAEKKQQPTSIELELFRRGRKIDALRSYRQRTDFELREVFDMFEKLI